MDPFNPFAGIPGDPMEQVLSLQTFDSDAVPGPVPCVRTNACRTCACVTNSCDTIGCTYSCDVPPGTEFDDVEEGW
jgi:hypothetical protein